MNFKNTFKCYLPPAFINCIVEVLNNNIKGGINEELFLNGLQKELKKSVCLTGGSKSILFYPKLPCQGYMIYKICRVLGLNIVTNPHKPFDVAMFWSYETHKRIPNGLKSLKSRDRLINGNCLDISKRHVDNTFKEVFNYNSLVDPLTFSGECVVKSDINAKNDGKVIRCPIDTLEDGRVYQKFIVMDSPEGYASDYRVPIFKQEIPVVLQKYYPLKDRFKTFTKADLLETQEVFDTEEIEKILLFCERIGLDYGELDVLRDKDTRLLYIIDVNNAPWGGNHMRVLGDKKAEALKKLAKAFFRNFVS